MSDVSAKACPALLISAPASGQGKTSVTAALARKHRDAGRRVRVFKTGPDFLDPMILQRASGNPVYQLDLFMVGEADCRRLLHDAALEADLILIEGVMGLFDGAPSSADLAALFGIPVLAVIDARAMAQTFGAVAHGLATWRADVRLAGVLANRVGSTRHADMLKASLPPGLDWYGALPPEAAHALPERHLGLVQADEVADLEARIQHAAEALPPEACRLPAPVAFEAGEAPPVHPLLQGQRIAIARDAAFSFLYPANLDLLAALGAELVFFSPLNDVALPACDAVWLPGGYPELHLSALADNTALHAALREHHAAGKPILAECGGMLYLAESLTDAQGRQAVMAGLLPARAVMQPRLAGLGLQGVELPEGVLRGHTFHHSRLETDLPVLARAGNPNGGAGEAVYRLDRLTAGYVHFYFPSNPEATARLFLS
ncbi:MAG: cobyrinate a,c-diamide synthase [Pseudomonadota bacterium]|nr:cobyrinate a,c-diamide synthase [Pseudomonadota bacterium]